MKLLLAVAFVALLGFFSLPTASAQSLECQFCKFAVNFIEGYLQENATESEIVRYLDAICSLAPSSIAAECKKFVVQEVPALVQYIIRTESPATACSQLGLCSTFKHKETTKHGMLKLKKMQ